MGESEKAKKKFVSQLAHDIKNYIGNTSMYSEMLMAEVRDQVPGGGVNEEFAEHLLLMLENIRLSATGLLSEVDSWSAAQKIKNNDYKVTKEDVDVADLLRQVIEDTKMYLDKKGIKVKASYAYEECMAYTDPFLLKTVFRNILDMMLLYASKDDTLIARVDMNGDVYNISFEDSYQAPRKNIEYRFMHGIDVDFFEVPKEGILKPAGYGIMFCGEALSLLNAGQMVAPSVNGGLSFSFNIPLS